MNYRKIWEKHFGPIPKDTKGFSYEIHHKDGNHKNNSLDNLVCVTIEEHLKIHLQQEDWFAAALIAKRIGLGPAYTASLQKGKKRPGVGGVKKGTTPWNKDKKNCFNADTILKFKNTRKGRRFGLTKVSDNICIEILKMFNSRPFLEGVGSKSRNGKMLTYERLFANHYSKDYNITPAQLYNIITGKRYVLQN
jgi:hypothetical protein